MHIKVWIVAAKEWRDGWRNRWVIGATLIFAVMALGITWFGGVVNGQSGVLPLAATIASLSSLTVLVVPLIALLLGYDAFVGEQEQGTLLLLLTYPLKKIDLILGKFLGQLAILFVATLIGFGSAAVAFSWNNVSWSVIQTFLVFILSATLLGAVFLTLAHGLSLWVSEKAQAAGLALLVWFSLTLLYDLALLALLVGREGWLNESVLTGLLMFNPTDLFRLINLVSIDAQGIGVLASLGQMNISLPALYACLMVWIAASLALSLLRFHQKKV